MPIQTRSMTSSCNFNSKSVASKNTSHREGVQTRKMRNQEKFNTRRVTRSMTQSNREMNQIFEAAYTLMMMRYS